MKDAEWHDATRARLAKWDRSLDMERRGGSRAYMAVADFAQTAKTVAKEEAADPKREPPSDDWRKETTRRLRLVAGMFKPAEKERIRAFIAWAEEPDR